MSEEQKERHEIFKQLYQKASLGRLEFNAAIEVFKEENPDYISTEKIDPGINAFKKYLRGKMW